MKILITGGTGSLGHKLIDSILLNSDYSIVVVSRGEQKQFTMKSEYKQHIPSRIKLHIADIVDYNAINGIISKECPDVIINTAAQKHISLCEENPWQATRNNIIGVKNLVDICVSSDIKCFCQISTDKAVLPTTLYGMTKYIGEQLVNSAQSSGKMCGVRYGNVLNSKGSLLPIYNEISKTTKIFPLTDIEMTRFFISYDSAIYLIYKSISNVYSNFNISHNIDKVEIFGSDGCFLIPVLKSAKIIDIANAYAEHYGGSVNIIGRFTGEKTHEVLANGYSSYDRVMATTETKKMLFDNGCFI